MPGEFWLGERQWRRLSPPLPNKLRVDDRRVIGSIVHVLRSGCRLTDAPAVYGPRKTFYIRFVRWAAARKLQHEQRGRKLASCPSWSVSGAEAGYPNRLLATLPVI